jgi:hypothetical protein
MGAERMGDFAFVVPIITALIAGVSAVKASRAERNSRPTSNGFAGGVTRSLEALEAHLDDVHKDVREVRSAVITHLENHP